MRDTTAGVSCWESFVPGGSIGAACWESFIPVWPAGFRVGRVLSRRWSCVRYKVLPARLASAVGVKKFSLQARNGLVSPFCGVLGEFCPGWVHRGRLLGEFYTGSIRRLSCGESFVPVVHLTCGAGGVLSRSSGETARSEGGARPAGPGRASRRRAERSSRRGRRAGGQASHRTEIWRGARSCSRDRLLLGPVLLSSHPQLVLL